MIIEIIVWSVRHCDDISGMLIQADLLTLFTLYQPQFLLLPVNHPLLQLLSHLDTVRKKNGLVFGATGTGLALSLSWMREPSSANSHKDIYWYLIFLSINLKNDYLWFLCFIIEGTDCPDCSFPGEHYPGVEDARLVSSVQGKSPGGCSDVVRLVSPQYWELGQWDSQWSTINIDISTIQHTASSRAGTNWARIFHRVRYIQIQARLINLVTQISQESPSSVETAGLE